MAAMSDIVSKLHASQLAAEAAGPAAPAVVAPAPAEGEVPPADEKQQHLGISFANPWQNPPGFRFVLEPDPTIVDLYPKAFLLTLEDGAEFNSQLLAGVDLLAPCDVTLPPGESTVVPLLVSLLGLVLYWGPLAKPIGVPSAFLIFASDKIPGGTDLVFTGGVGLVDVLDRDPLCVRIHNLGKTPVAIPKGTPLARAAGPSFPPIEFTRADPGSALSRAMRPDPAE